MRGYSLSLILGLTLMISGVSMAGTSDNGIPNAGLFVPALTANF